MDFHALCEQLNLGALTEEPMRLTGGLMHKMVRITTDSGVYAVKCLNPHVMARPTAAANFDAAEALERQLEGTDLPILAALTIGGRKMQELDGNYFYVFPYFDGKPLTDGEITLAHCREMGRCLATIHGVSCRHDAIPSEPLTFDWRAFPLSPQDRTLLWEMQSAANAAVLPPRLTVCHRDMDPKNVLWRGAECRIIDLECLGYDSPYRELLETALCWAGYESGTVDWDRFCAFVEGYAANGGDLCADWAAVYAANSGRLEWLAYNLRRAAGEEGEEAKALGAAEVEKTLTCIRGYAATQSDVVGILEAMKKEGSV